MFHNILPEPKLRCNMRKVKCRLVAHEITKTQKTDMLSA